MPPQLTKHEKIVTAHTADVVIKIWDAIRQHLPQFDRDPIDTHVAELRRMIVPSNPNTKASGLGPPPSSGL